MAQAGWYADPYELSPLRWWDGTTWTEHVTGPPPFDAQRWAGHFGAAEPTVEPAAGTPVGATASLFDHVLGSADRIAVLDVETTGLYSNDRVVEVAVVTIDRFGRVIDEFDTLVDPRRDVGPTWVHGITSSMVSGAPTFDEIAHHVAARLDGAICVAHNLPFDRRMIGYELDRVGIDVEWGVGLDTLVPTGCKLGVACAEHGVVLDDAHRALADARATAALTVAVADLFDTVGVPVLARPLTVRPIRVVTRDGHSNAVVPEPYLAALAAGVHASADFATYEALLAIAIADLQLTVDERDELAALADELGLDERQVALAHREFLDGLIDEALEDHVLTDDEYEQLYRAAALLEVELDVVIRRVGSYRDEHDQIDDLAGLTVCFTGDLDDGVYRSDLEELARSAGLFPIGSVTKKGCDLLVVADPATSSRKAEAARKFGTAIASQADFIGAVENGSGLAVTRRAPEGIPLVCSGCGTSWMAGRRSAKPRCADCRRGRRAAR